MRLIDADALRMTMYHEAFEVDSDMQKWDGGCWIRYKMFENAIEAAPTIEAEPVKHGRWETEVRTVLGAKVPFFACSVCGSNADDEYAYCPHCGAKMEPISASPENGQEVEA